MSLQYLNRIAVSIVLVLTNSNMCAVVIPDVDLVATASRITSLLAKEAQNEIANGFDEVAIDVKNRISANKISNDENIAANNIARQTGAMHETANAVQLAESRPAPNACQIFSANKAIAASQSRSVVDVLNEGDRQSDQLGARFVTAAVEANSTGDRRAIERLNERRQQVRDNYEIDLVQQFTSGRLSFLDPGVGVTDIWESQDDVANAYRFGSLLVPDDQAVNMFAGTRTSAAARHTLVAGLSERARFNLERAILRELQALAQYQGSVTVLSWMEEQTKRLPGNVRLLSTSEVTKSTADLYRQRMVAMVGELGIAYQALHMARLKEMLLAVRLVAVSDNNRLGASKWQI